MKVNSDFILKKIAGDYMVIPVGNNLVDFNAVITLNETGAFLWDKLQSETTLDALCLAMCSKFNIDKDTAKADIDEFLNKLSSVGILEND